MSSLSATQSDGYYLPPEYFESGAYKKVSRNRFAAESELKSKSKSQANSSGSKPKVGHNQWLKHGVVRFELAEKAVCLGCKQSVGRGTRFNARKIKTDQSYFSTPIFEFRLSCRNCQEPWVIRTNPQDRGFEYVSGVKRQAGQDRNLVEDSFEAESGTGSAAAASHGDALDKLEASVVAGKTMGGKVYQTEIEHLEALKTLNERVSAGGKDVDHNASIRKSFRTDRREHRKRSLGATSLGWKSGMTLLPSNDSDRLASKETVYGRASKDERSKLSKVRTSSIFASSSKPRHRSKHNRMSKRRRREASAPSLGSAAPEMVTSEAAAAAPLEGTVANHGCSPESIPEPIPSMPSSSLQALPTPIIPKKTTLRLSNGVVSIAKRGTQKPSFLPCSPEIKAAKHSTKSASNAGSSSESQQDTLHAATTSTPGAKGNASVSLLELVGDYGSSDDDEE